MNSGTTVFSQILAFIDYEDFRRCVRKYDGDSRVGRLSCWEQFLALSFAQLTRRESLRDIEVSLNAHALGQLAVPRIENRGRNQREIVSERNPAQHRQVPRKRERNQADREQNVEEFAEDEAHRETLS